MSILGNGIYTGGGDAPVTFSEATSRENVASGEKQSVLWGKVQKWFNSLGALAFKNSVSKGDVGLSNVDNVKQYSASNPPPYPVTSVNGKTGAVTISTGASAPSTTNLLKGNGSGGISAAVPGTDYMQTTNITKQTLVNAETNPTANGVIHWVYG